MSLQIFLEGKLLGVDDCLLALASKDPDRVFTGRSHWISLLSEILPRALLAELGLAKILLGSSGGSQFLVVLPEEARPAAEAFLEDRKSTRLNSSHTVISYAVFCLKKKRIRPK